MKTYRWKCTRCGSCCTHTINETPLGTFGVFLLPFETKLFPHQVIKPMYGVGKKGKSRPRPAFIHAYQMTAQPCVWYNEKQRLCGLYDMRPLGCRQFPLSSSFVAVMLHRECPQIASLIPEGAQVRKEQLKGFKTEEKAMRTMNNYFRGVYVYNLRNVDTSVTWAYPLNLDKWIRPSEDDYLRTATLLKDRLEVLGLWHTRKDTAEKSTQ